MDNHDSFVTRTRDEIDRLASIAEYADLTAPVPTCPGWTMAKLVKHTGSAHRWATAIVAARASEPVDPRSLDLGLPDSESGYAAWLADGGERLAETLREAGPDAPVWTWGPGRTSGWWVRRMLHETVVHRADADLAAGREPEIDAATAADGIDEFLANLPALGQRTGRLAEFPAGESLHLHATGTGTGTGGDTGGEWLVRFAGDGITVSREHAKATTAVRGPATALLLFTYGRIPWTDESLTVFGDEALADAWQDRTAL